MENARSALRGDVVICAASAAECVAMADVLAITTPWAEFRRITPADLKASSGRPTVVDCWRVLDDERFEEAAQYLKLGLGSETQRSSSERSKPVLSRAGGN